MKLVSIPVVNGDIHSFEDATCKATSGADAIMIGRAAQGRPWSRGISRVFHNRRSRAHTSLSEQFTLIDALMKNCSTTTACDRPPPRSQHLGWLDPAAATIGASAELLQPSQPVLTAEQPSHARRFLADAYDDFTQRAAA